MKEGPISNVVKYEIRSFTQGLFDDRTEFMGSPNETNEAAWQEIIRRTAHPLPDCHHSSCTFFISFSVSCRIIWVYQLLTNFSYLVGIIKLDDEQMLRLPGSSVRFHDEPRFWLAGFEMYHQLHCLHHLRMLLWAKEPTIFYGRDSTVDKEAAHLGKRTSRLFQEYVTRDLHGCVETNMDRYELQRSLYWPSPTSNHLPRQHRYHNLSHQQERHQRSELR